MGVFVNQVLGIIATASVAALVASGLAVSFRLMGVINLAHGEFLMLGAYAAVSATMAGLPFPVAVLVAVLVGVVVGVLVEAALIRPFYRRTELTILSTFGLSLVLRQLVELLYGPNYQPLSSPMSGSVHILGTEFPEYRLVLAAIAIAVIGALIYVLTATPLGVRIRAVASDDGLSESVGIRAGRLKLGVFALSTGLASLTGALIAPTTNVAPGMGQDFLFIAFVVVIIGGTRLPTVVRAAIIVAAIQNLTTLSVNSVAAQLAVLLVAFVVLAASQRRSEGVTV